MTKTKKQKRREAGLEKKAPSTTAGDWLALVVVIALFVGAVWVFNAVVTYFFPNYDLLGDLLGALQEMFFPNHS